MKKINLVKALIILLFLSNTAISQYSMSSAIGYGIKVNKDYNYDLFQSSVTIEPQYDIDNFKMSAMAIAVNDSIADFYFGIKAGYKIWQDEMELRQLYLSGSALQGLEGRGLIGGGVTYHYNNMFVGMDLYHEKKNNELWGMLNVGIFILK